MISGAKQASIRKATAADLDTVKTLADRHKRELGFIIRSALQVSISKGEVFVAIAAPNVLCGFVHYRHRKDGQTTLYSVVVESNWRGQGIGWQLVEALLTESMHMDKDCVLLRCPADLAANDFYSRCGFVLDRTEKGKQRQLNVWVHAFDPPSKYHA